MTTTHEPSSSPAAPRFARETDLPFGGADEYLEAVEAIKHEHRATSEWKPLRCLRVECVEPTERLYRLDTGTALGLEHGWEGSTVLRPAGGAARTVDLVNPSMGDDNILWSGPVVEADEASGSLYVAIDGARAPSRGTFYLRPFEFTALLSQLYTANDYRDLRVPLSVALYATTTGGESPGGVIPPGEPAAAVGWSAPWNILWGPPGTGKTRLIGDRVARLLEDPDERVLVVSTTNDATDQVAVSVGRAARALGRAEAGTILRVGRGARYRTYDQAQQRDLLQGGEFELRRQIEIQRSKIDAADQPAERARLRHQLGALVRQLRNAGSAAVRESHHRVLVTTAFQALSYVLDRETVGPGHTPFTTVVLDEAGLISRATVAALSLLASRRLVLVGDPRQLAPIARMARILPPGQARWLGLSALHHLRGGHSSPTFERLSRQYRMHPHIRTAVSAYQYDGQLTDAPELAGGAEPGLPERRALWYVLDEERCEPHRLRADRGDGNRSWVRPHTPQVLERLFAEIPAVRDARGLFLSPFAGQCRAIADHFRLTGATDWRASTVHQQQGAEADVVIFDTVNAGSHCWPLDEWERLINVAASRARKLFVLLATRDEARQPFLAPLVAHLWPCAFVYSGRAWRLEEVTTAASAPDAIAFDPDDQRLGAQLARRKALRPILSYEQQRLCRFEMDGKARLVRGVAGSGKTVVLANWLVQTYLSRPESPPRLWVVYANAALRGLIQRCIEDAWLRAGQHGAAPWSNIDLHHIDNLLASFERPKKVAAHHRFEYELRARGILSRPQGVTARCDALFMDEAQDLGPATIALLTQLTKQSDPDDPKSRAVHVFYDNAQNVYGRGTPTWSDLGLDVRGRSVVMKESFRSTRPISEFALNTLARLTDFDRDEDQREYIERRLIERTERDGKAWWQVNYNEIDGPAPRFHRFKDRASELKHMCTQVFHWLAQDKVAPADIAIVTMGQDGGRSFGETVAAELADHLRKLNVSVEYRTATGFENRARTVVVTTPHSFKGYEAEVVWAAGLDRFHHGGKPAAAPLYVALTRARSILVASATNATEGPGRALVAALTEAGNLVGLAPSLQDGVAALRDATVRQLVDLLDPEHHAWLHALLRTHQVTVEPVETSSGEILGEPFLVARRPGETIAFFGRMPPPSRAEIFRLEDAGIRVLLVGHAP